MILKIHRQYLLSAQHKIVLIELTYGAGSSETTKNTVVLPVYENDYSYENKEYVVTEGELFSFKILFKKSETEFSEVLQFVKIPQKGNKAEFWSGVEENDITADYIQSLQDEPKRPYYYDYLKRYFGGQRIFKPVETKSQSINPNCPNGQSTTIYNRNIRPCKEELIFEENFDSLDFTKWQGVIELASDEYDAEFVSFQNNSNNVFIYEGILNIVPTLLSDSREFLNVKDQSLDLSSVCTATEDRYKSCKRTAGGFTILPPIVSAKIQTRNFFSFKYGRVVVRAMVPKGDWIFPLIALDPTTFKYGTKNYQSGQIRIALVRGNEQLTLNNEEVGGKVLYAGPIISPGENNRTILKSKKDNEHFSSKFHDYEVVWTPEHLKFFVDNEQYGEILPNDINFEKSRGGGAMAPFDQEFHLTLGLSVGGLADFPDGSLTGPTKTKKPWDNGDPKQEVSFWSNKNNWLATWDHLSSLQVDFVRVFALG
ncbi:GNBPA1 family protein [Megaselia abdita]